MFLIQEKKINFLYIKLNTSCVRSAPHPLYSASCRCSSRAVASASHHLPPPPHRSASLHSALSIRPPKPCCSRLISPRCLFWSFSLSLPISRTDGRRFPSHPLASPPKHHHRRSVHSKKPSAWCVWELLPCSINFWKRNE